MNITVKKADIALQAAAFFIPLVIAMAWRDAGTAFFSYFSVGGMQVLSCLVHLASPVQPVRRSRKQYQYCLLAVFLIFLPLVFPLVMETGHDLFVVYLYLLFALLFVSPVMAFWYFRISLAELGMMKAGRPIRHDSCYGRL